MHIEIAAIIGDAIEMPIRLLTWAERGKKYCKMMAFNAI